MVKFIAALVVLAGCSGVVEPSFAEQWCAEHACDLTPLALAPAVGGPNVTPSAVKWLRDGTGLDIVEDAFGVPVRFVDVLSDPASEGGCATTATASDSSGAVLGSEIEIVFPEPPGCRPAWATLMHEAIHAFCPGAEHTTSGGIFDEHANPTVRVDAEAADLLLSCVR